MEAASFPGWPGNEANTSQKVGRPGSIKNVRGMQDRHMGEGGRGGPTVDMYSLNFEVFWVESMCALCTTVVCA